jgi:hypothetical protein
MKFMQFEIDLSKAKEVGSEGWKYMCHAEADKM